MKNTRSNQHKMFKPTSLMASNTKMFKPTSLMASNIKMFKPTSLMAYNTKMFKPTSLMESSNSPLFTILPIGSRTVSRRVFCIQFGHEILEGLSHLLTDDIAMRVYKHSLPSPWKISQMNPNNIIRNRKWNKRKLVIWCLIISYI